MSIIDINIDIVKWNDLYIRMCLCSYKKKNKNCHLIAILLSIKIINILFQNFKVN